MQKRYYNPTYRPEQNPELEAQQTAGLERLFAEYATGGRPTLKYGLSTAFLNKDFTGQKRYCKKHKSFDGCWAFGYSFEPTEGTFNQLWAHVSTGGAFTPGYFAGKSRRKDTFISAQVIGLDFDENVSIDDLLAIPFMAQYARGMYPTPSHTPEYARTRPLFVLDRAITDWQEYESLVSGLMAMFAHLNPDEHCKDAARLYFGSTQPGAYLNPAAIVPVDTLKAYIATYIEENTPALKNPEQDCIRLDSEVGRLSYVLSFSAHLRLWAIARAKRDGKWNFGAFWQEIASYGIQYSSKQKKRILDTGNGVFWNLDDKMKVLYLRHPGAELVSRAKIKNPELIASNLPGLKRDAYIPKSAFCADLELWNAHLYAGWFAAKKQTEITRALLCKLFNTSKRTLIRWEKRLNGIVTVTQDTKVSPKSPEECNAPKHAITYTVMVGGAGDTPAHEETRTAWQIQNKYTSKIRVHKRNGQRKRILGKSRIAAGLQPSTDKDGGLPRNPRQLFTNPERACKAATRRGEPVGLKIGYAANGVCRYEQTKNGVVTISAIERIIPASPECWYKWVHNA